MQVTVFHSRNESHLRGRLPRWRRGCRRMWEHANKVLIKVIGKFVKLPQLFHFFVVNDLH